MSINRGWTQEYYDLLEFYYWEPQHLNRQSTKSGTKTTAQVFERLQKLEVSFNHLLNIFFALAPDGLINRIFERVVNSSLQDKKFVAQGRNAKAHAVAAKICQPDLLFEGHHDRIALEIKFDFKTSLEQVVKYAIFLKSYGDALTRSKNLHLVFLSPNPKIWKGKITFDNYASNLPDFELPKSVCRLMSDIGLKRDQVIHDAQSLSVSHFSYANLFQYLVAERNQLSKSDGDQTLRKLIDGLLAELGLRDPECASAFLDLSSNEVMMDEASVILGDVEGPQALSEIREILLSRGG